MAIFDKPRKELSFIERFIEFFAGVGLLIGAFIGLILLILIPFLVFLFLENPREFFDSPLIQLFILVLVFLLIDHFLSKKEP